jgi:acetyl coenzyme A synthetase (ADP forming)-like protein
LTVYPETGPALDQAADPVIVAAYPAARATDVVLHSGGTAHVRPVCPDDREALRAFLGALSNDARAFRFFGGGVNLDAMADLCAAVDYRDSYGIVAIASDDQRIVAHAMYAGGGDESVEVAFAIADDLQGQGLGTVLLAHLAEAAAACGYTQFHAEVLADNHRMLEVFRDSGFPVVFGAGDGFVSVQSPISLSPYVIQRFESRDHEAAVAAVQHILRPRSVALIGASRRRDSVGGAIFHNLIEAGFTGPLYPVNPAATSVQGVPAYGSIRDVPARVDLAVIAVPAGRVVSVARECGAALVTALVVVSGGFGEAGEEGKALQDELLRVCREYGMRLVGPNCLGILDTAADVRLNATFARRMPPRGPLALMSQSGALGLAAIDQAAERGLGLASFVSAGNKADVSGNDLIRYWADDPAVGVIALYLESFGNARKFASIAPRVGRRKPIVAVKSGRSRAGARAAGSHTGAALAASDITVDALFSQTGVIRADTLAELLDVSALLGSQPLPKGNRVAVVTNSGGPGILCTDALDAEGMVLAELSQQVIERLRAILPAAASVQNPVDMLATADGDLYARVMGVFAEAESVDAVIVIYTPTGLDEPARVLEGIGRGADELAGRLPALGVALTPRPAGGLIRTKRSQLPLYGYPENAARALGLACRYASWRERPAGAVRAFEDVRPDEAAAVITAALAHEDEWLAPEPAATLLRSYGIAMVTSHRAASPTAVGRVAGEMGGPVAVKAIASTLLHKTEAGAVGLGLVGAAEAMRAASELGRRLRAEGHAIEGFVVQRMAEPGAEILVGVVHDAVFGPVVVCGAGGTSVELLKDTAAAVTPLTDLDAHDLVRSLRTFPLLDGWRGAPKADVAGLEEMLLRVSALVEAHPEVAELDLNPVIVGASGAVAVDVRVRIESAAAAPPWPSVNGVLPAATRLR